MSVRGAPTLLRSQLAHAFAAARWQVANLTDDEYLWEPAPVCWSVRRRGDAWLIQDEWPLTGPPPPTTIAWRLVHLAAWTDVYRDWTFGDARVAYTDIDVPGHAADAVARLHRAQDDFARGAASTADEDFVSLRPTHFGEQHEIGLLVWQIAVEHLHHSAEIGVLRDLHRGHGRTDWWPEPLT